MAAHRGAHGLGAQDDRGLAAGAREMDQRCGEAVAWMDEEEFERLCEAEEAKVDVYRKPVKDAAERDVWPRDLYFGRI